MVWEWGRRGSLCVEILCARLWVVVKYMLGFFSFRFSLLLDLQSLRPRFHLSPPQQIDTPVTYCTTLNPPPPCSSHPIRSRFIKSLNYTHMHAHRLIILLYNLYLIPSLALSPLPTLTYTNPVLGLGARYYDRYHYICSPSTKISFFCTITSVVILTLFFALIFHFSLWSLVFGFGFGITLIRNVVANLYKISDCSFLFVVLWLIVVAEN